MSMIRQKNMSKQSVVGNRPNTRPGTRRNSVTASGYASSAGSLLWAARNSIAFRTGKGGFKVPKYQNTYQLESPNPMEISVIDKILTNVMNEQLKDVKNYEPARSKKLCQDMGIEIRKQIYKKNYARYKFIVTGQQAEKRLAVLYLSSLMSSTISALCIIIVWQYWSDVINDCLQINCGCLLYGSGSYKYFRGGDKTMCSYPTYLLIPSIIGGLIFGIYHGYRSFIDRNLSGPRVRTELSVNYNKSNGAGQSSNIFVVGPRTRSSYKQWTLAAFLTSLVGLLALTNTILITDGYYQTCITYRKYVAQALGSTGQEAQLVHNRLSCSAIYDYMDYIQPDPSHGRPGFRINTSFFLQIAIVTSWINFLSWLTSFGINIYMTRQRLRSLGQSLCCSVTPR